MFSMAPGTRFSPRLRWAMALFPRTLDRYRQHSPSRPIRMARSRSYNPSTTLRSNTVQSSTLSTTQQVVPVQHDLDHRQPVRRPTLGHKFGGSVDARRGSDEQQQRRLPVHPELIPGRQPGQFCRELQRPADLCHLAGQRLQQRQIWRLRQSLRSHYAGAGCLD